MGKRRAARELALRTLFQIDLARLDAAEAMEAALAEDTLAEDARDFARELVMGAVKKQKHIDLVIAKYARGWTLDRMANMDRNILRLAIFEILYLPDIPPSVTVDEAVELAKRYSTAESGRFVNGILGNLVRNLEAESAEAQVA
jgi:N utilization substance protein B